MTEGTFSVVVREERDGGIHYLVIGSAEQVTPDVIHIELRALPLNGEIILLRRE